MALVGMTQPLLYRADEDNQQSSVPICPSSCPFLCVRISTSQALGFENRP
jgi:hypothetical protein